MDKPDQSAEHRRSRRWFDWGRRVIAGAIAAALAVEWVISSFRAPLCHDALATVGSTAVVRICGPIGLSDLAPFALIVALLVAPDFSELGLFGVLSLKRQLVEQGRRQAQLEHDLVQVKTAVSQRQDVHLEFRLPPDPQKALADLNEKQSEFIKVVPPWAYSQARSSSHGNVTPQRAEKESQLIRLWEDLQSYLGLVNRGDGVVGRTVGEWREVFQDQIWVVQAARNSIAHAVPISDEDLDDALLIGEGLRKALDAKLDIYRPPAPQG